MVRIMTCFITDGENPGGLTYISGSKKDEDWNNEDSQKWRS
jgi:hypothetical protein